MAQQFTPLQKRPAHEGADESQNDSKSISKSQRYNPLVIGSTFSPKEKNYLLSLAKKSIKAVLGSNDLSVTEKDLASENLSQKKSCFVTLTANGKLRGCVGNISACQELWRDVMENARAAAFGDPRFLPLKKEEFKNINIEISVLSAPKKVEYETTEKLLDYLNKNKQGVIIKKGLRSATFLPQVWEEIGGPEEFLSHLCLKAGLSADEWANGGVEVEIYRAEKIR